MKHVFVPMTGDPGCFMPVVKMFEEEGYAVYTKLDGEEEIDLVCFTGGSDVSPMFYDEENTTSYCDFTRDMYEFGVFTLMPHIPKVGICRGAQFLNVMHGGKLVQHIDGHNMDTHKIHKFLEGGGSNILGEVLGDHHQAMIPRGQEKIEKFHTPDPGVTVIAIADDDVPEVLFYEESNDVNKSLCFQPHPEWWHKETRTLFFNLLDDYIFGVKYWPQPEISGGVLNG